MTAVVTTAPLDRSRRLPRPAAVDLTLTRAVSGLKVRRLPLNPIPPGAPDGRWTEQSHGPARRCRGEGRCVGPDKLEWEGRGDREARAYLAALLRLASVSLVGMTELRSTV